MKQVAKEAFENNMDHHDTPKTISEDYLNNQECSNQILLVLKIRRIFPNVYFVNTNPTKKIAQFFFSEKELRKLSGNRPNIFKKSNVDR